MAKLNTWLQKVDRLVEQSVETSLDNASDYVDIYKKGPVQFNLTIKKI